MNKLVGRLGRDWHSIINVCIYGLSYSIKVPKYLVDAGCRCISRTARVFRLSDCSEACAIVQSSACESRSKLLLTSFSLGGSCCAKIPKIDRGRPKIMGLIHLRYG